MGLMNRDQIMSHLDAEKHELGPEFSMLFANMPPIIVEPGDGEKRHTALINRLATLATVAAVTILELTEDGDCEHSMGEHFTAFNHVTKEVCGLLEQAQKDHNEDERIEAAVARVLARGRNAPQPNG